MAKIYLETADTTFNVSNNNTTVIDSVGVENTVTVAAGVTGLSIASTIEDVDFTGNIADYQFQQVAGTADMNVLDGSGNVIATVSNTLKARTLSFADGTVDVKYDATASATTVGGTAVTATAAAVVPATIDATDVSSNAGSTGGGSTGGTSNFTLTTNADAITGTSNDDVFNALVGTNSVNGNSQDTAQSFDAVAGGDGNDTINISSNTANANIGITLGSVETINFTTYKSGGVVVGSAGNINLANTTGTTTLNNNNSIATFVATSVGELANIGVKGTSNATEVNFSDSSWASLTDATNLNLNGVTGQANVTLTGANDIETLNVMTSGSDSEIDLGGTAIDGTTTLNVSGTAGFSFDDTDNTTKMTALKTIDASGLTAGALDADVRNSATNLTVTGSAQDDKLTMSGLTKDDSIDMGDGNDTLTVRTADALSITSSPTMTGVETIAFVLDTDKDNAAEHSAVRMTNATSLKTIVLGAQDDAGDSGSDVSLTKLPASAVNVTFNGDGATADTEINGLVYSLADATGTSDTLNVNVDNVDTNGNLINTTKGAQLTTNLTANKVETINLTTAKLHSDTNATTQDGGVSMLIDDDSLQTLNVTSETLVDLTRGTTGVEATTTLHNIDASAANGGVLLDISSAADSSSARATVDKSLTVKTGDGNDTISNVLAAVKTSITTAAGKDTVTLTTAGHNVLKALTIDTGADNDTITLTDNQTGTAHTSVTTGDGVDTVTVYGGTSGGTNNLNTEITDFVVGAGGDKLDLSANAAVDSSSSTTLTTFQNDGAKVAATTGLYIVQGDIAAGAAATAAQIFTGLTTAAAADNDVMYVAYDDGTDTFIDMVTMNGADGWADDTSTNEVTKIATLTGVNDATNLTVDNFVDFLA